MNSAVDRDGEVRAGIEAALGGVRARRDRGRARDLRDGRDPRLPAVGRALQGRSKIEAQRGGHPAERHFSVRRILGGGDLWVSECVITYDGAPTQSVSVMEFSEGLVVHETQYFADPFPAAPARAALAEPIPPG